MILYAAAERNIRRNFKLQKAAAKAAALRAPSYCKKGCRKSGSLRINVQ